MIVDRYYYQQLNKSEKVVYKAIYQGVMSHQAFIPLPVKGKLPDGVLEKIFSALTNDNPLIYFLNQSMYSYAIDAFGHIALCPQYFFDEDKVRDYNRRIEKVVSGLVNQLQLVEVSDYEKEKRVHDWMCRNVEYDFEGSDVNNTARVIASHNIIGVLAHHKAQCEGIAKAVKVILNAVDMKCIVVTGEATDKEKKELHAWNIVKIDDVPYQLDVTWDIGHKRPNSNQIPYEYFNVNDELMYKTHKPNNTMPKCDSMQENYFTKNGVAFQTKKQLVEYIKSNLNKGIREFYFRIDGKVKVSAIANEITNFVANALAEQGKQSIRVHQSPDDEMRTCWIKID